MTQHEIIYVRALDCYKSPNNVRTQSDPEADAELAANIGEAKIILENLIGVRAPRNSKKGKFEIYGGGRRLDGTHAVIAAGKLDEDFMIPLLLAKTAKDAIEMSLWENYFQLPMNPADECRAFQSIIDREKKKPIDVAKRIGKTERYVDGRLRLANLAEPVFDALRKGEITIDVAMAYAHTSDTDRQAKVFAQMGASYYGHNANEIRRAVAVGTFKGGDPKALLVGRDTYLAAGGRIAADLYTDELTELWLDGELVEKLADEAMATAASAIREREGFAEVRVVSATTIPYTDTYQLTRIVGERAPLTAEAEARRAEIDAELTELETAGEEADGYTEEQAERVEALEEEIGAILNTPVIVSDEQRASAIAYVMIGKDGQPIIHEQLYVAPVEDPDAVEEGEDPTDEVGEAVDQTESEVDEVAGAPAESYSQKLKDELAMMKTELLALHVANDPHFALDLGTFIMVDKASRLGFGSLPSELRAEAPSPRVAGFKSETPAAEAWGRLDEGLDCSWINHKEIHERYDAFCALDDGARAAWLGWAIARTLHAVPDGQPGTNFINHLGAKLHIDVAAWWRPTARNFFSRINKAVVLKLFETVGGLELRNRYAASRKFDLEASAEKLFAGQIIGEAEVKDRALAWLPGPMRFGPESDDEPELFGDLPTAANDAFPEQPGQDDDAADPLPEAA